MGKASRQIGVCIFCGTHGRMTEEHATPRWLGRFLAQQFPVSGRLEAVRVAAGPDGRPRQYARPVGGLSFHKAPVVCLGCNTRWMSRLETSVAPLLKTLVRGNTISLSVADARLLAIWATKTALVYEFIEQERDGTAASDADRRRFGKHQAPLPSSHVWLARYDGTGGTTIVVRRTLFLYGLDEEVPLPRAHGVLYGLVFGRLAIRVGIVRGDPTYPTRFDVAEGAETQRIWPDLERTTWPPDAALTDENFGAFTAVFMPEDGPGALKRFRKPDR